MCHCTTGCSGLERAGSEHFVGNLLGLLDVLPGSDSPVFLQQESCIGAMSPSHEAGWRALPRCKASSCVRWSGARCLSLWSPDTQSSSESSCSSATISLLSCRAGGSGPTLTCMNLVFVQLICRPSLSASSLHTPRASVSQLAVGFSEQLGIVGVLHISQMAAADRHSGDPLANPGHQTVNDAVVEVRSGYTARVNAAGKGNQSESLNTDTARHLNRAAILGGAPRSCRTLHSEVWRMVSKNPMCR